MIPGDLISGVVGHPDMFLFWCPGCQCAHFVDHRWTFNGDKVKPTIRASLLIHGPKGDGSQRCHLVVTDGEIRYLGDCGHELKGQTVDMVPFPGDDDSPEQGQQ